MQGDRDLIYETEFFWSNSTYFTQRGAIGYLVLICITPFSKIRGIILMFFVPYHVFILLFLSISSLFFLPSPTLLFFVLYCNSVSMKQSPQMILEWNVSMNTFLTFKYLINCIISTAHTDSFRQLQSNNEVKSAIKVISILSTGAVSTQSSVHSKST